MKSSLVFKYIGQYGFLAEAIAWLVGSVFALIEGLQGGDWQMEAIFARGTIGLIHFAAFLYFWKKFVVVELHAKKVKILSDGETIEATWQNVESVEGVFSGPIYIIRIKGRKGYFIFWSSTIDELGVDNSQIGELISQKKKKLDI